MLPEIRQTGFICLTDQSGVQQSQRSGKSEVQKKHSKTNSIVNCQQEKKTMQQFFKNQRTNPQIESRAQNERICDVSLETQKKYLIQGSSLPQISQKLKAINKFKARTNHKTKINKIDSPSIKPNILNKNTFLNDSCSIKSHSRSQAKQKYLQSYQFGSQVVNSSNIKTRQIPSRFGSVSPDGDSNNFYNSNGLFFGNKSKVNFIVENNNKAATSKYYRKASLNPFRAYDEKAALNNNTPSIIQSPKIKQKNGNQNRVNDYSGHQNNKNIINFRIIPSVSQSITLKNNANQLKIKTSNQRQQTQQNQKLGVINIRECFQKQAFGVVKQEKQDNQIEVKKYDIPQEKLCQKEILNLRFQEQNLIPILLQQTNEKQEQKGKLVKTNMQGIVNQSLKPRAFKKIPDKRDQYQKMRHNIYLEKESYFDALITKSSIISYKMKSHIGKGCFSIVSEAIDRVSNISYAVKTYNKYTDLDWYRLQSIKKQISNLSLIQHQNIVQLMHVVKDKQKILLIMENAGKQSLAGIIRKQVKLSETIAKFYFKQICDAVKYCHDKGICHRDLKPQNILIDENHTIKLIDFGFSTDTKTKLNNFCGTPPFMSPQITKKQAYLGQLSDIWALGVLLYVMTHGKFPFRANNEQELYRMIQQGKYKVDGQISSDAKEIFAKMLKVIPQQRAPVENILSCRWFGQQKQDSNQLQ